MSCDMLALSESIDLREKLQENPIFHGKIYGVRLRFSLKSTHCLRLNFDTPKYTKHIWRIQTTPGWWLTFNPSEKI